jgi:hypothetical protein
VYADGAEQSGVATTSSSIPDTASATQTSPVTSALSSTGAVVIVRAANAARDVCPSTCSPCGVVFSTVTESETLRSVSVSVVTETAAPSTTQSTLFSTVTVQSYTYTSIQVVIQVTTTTAKANQQSSLPQSVGPASTSNGKTGQSNVAAQASQPSHLAPTTAPASTLVVAPLITLGGTTYTPNPSSLYTIGSSTLTPGGPPITVSGTVYSLGPGATNLVISGLSTDGAASIHVTPTTVVLKATSITESLPQTTTGGQVAFGGAVIWRKVYLKQKIMCAMCIAVLGLLF